MAIFKPYKITSSQLENLPITEGQFIVTTDTNKIYLDESTSSRIELIPVPTKTSDLVNDMNFMSGMTILAYGKSTWNDFITAYTAKHIVYTRASSGSNPASGSQTRMAFMAYVNNETNPTEVEFQYYRSVSTHSDSQQGDQTYIYKLNKTNGWSVTVRENYTKVVAGTGMSSTWSGGKITLNCTVTPPTKTSDLTNDSGFIDNTVNNLTNYPLTNSLSSVAFSGDYDDLSNKPTIPTVPTNVSAFTNDAGYITKNVNDLTNYTLTSNLSTVATSGDYDDLTNKPTIPTVNNATLTIQKNGTTVKTFTANASSDVTANITVPTKVSDLTNDSGYTTNTGTITGVSVNGTSVATSGVANIASVPASILTGAIPSAVTATTQSQGNNSTKIATTAYVDTAIDNLPEPMVFKGSLGTGGTVTSLPTDGSANIGDTYKVITAGTYASKVADVGDIFICLTKTSSANTWELIPSGDEPSGTVTSITLNATSPINIDSSSAITTSGIRTLSHANSGVTAGTYKSVTVNETGHVTAGTNPTTLSGYGITDAKIENGTITLGSNTITPLTSYTEINSNLVNGSTTGSLRTVSSAEESTNYTIGKNAFAQGMSTEASGLDSFAQGMYAKASGQDSFAQGRFTNASARGSHAEGESTTASGQGAHAEGYTTTASGAYSHAEGSSAHSVGDYSHAEGNFTWANGNYSHAEGYYAKASSQYQHVEGKFNVEDSNDTYVHIVGGGTGNTQKNIHTLTWAGEAWYQGDVYVGSTSGTNKDAGSQKLATETLVNTKQNQVLSGTTDPDNSLGENGDIYIKYSA